MKNLIYTLSAIVFLSACELISDHQSTFDFDPFVRTTAANINILENNPAGEVSVVIQLVGPAQAQDVEVTLSVETEGPMDDVTLPTSNVVVIPAGEFSARYTVRFEDNDEPDGDKLIRVSIEAVSGGLAIATPDTQRQGALITIIDDDCDIPNLEGLYRVVNRDANPAGCGNPANDGILAHEVEIRLIEDLGDFTFRYSITDITGGMYPNCYGAADNPAEFTTVVFDISVVDQPDVVYGGDVFNGTGSLDCDGDFEITWSNNFGDRATSIYTRL